MLSAKGRTMRQGAGGAMHYRYEYLPRPFRFGIPAAAVVAAVAIATFSSNYRPLAVQMQLRFLESQDRAPWQIEQREAAARKAAKDAADRQAAAERAARENARQAQLAREKEEREAAERKRIEEENERKAAIENDRQRQRQMADEQEKARLGQEYTQAVGEFRGIVSSRAVAISTMLKNVSGVISVIARNANDPAFYQGNLITAEDTASARPCKDPSAFADLFDRGTRRDRNIYACAVYLGMSREAAANPAERNVTTALMQRIYYDNDTVHQYPLQTIIAYLWIDHFSRKINEGETPNAVPPLIASDQLNYRLMNGLIHESFAKRLVGTATPEETIKLRTVTYPQLQRMEELATRLKKPCARLGISPCLPAR